MSTNCRSRSSSGVSGGSTVSEPLIDIDINTSFSDIDDRGQTPRQGKGSPEQYQRMDVDALDGRGQTRARVKASPKQHQLSKSNTQTMNGTARKKSLSGALLDANASFRNGIPSPPNGARQSSVSTDLSPRFSSRLSPPPRLVPATFQTGTDPAAAPDRRAVGHTNVFASGAETSRPMSTSSSIPTRQRSATGNYAVDDMNSRASLGSRPRSVSFAFGSLPDVGKGKDNGTGVNGLDTVPPRNPGTGNLKSILKSSSGSGWRRPVPDVGNGDNDTPHDTPSPGPRLSYTRSSVSFEAGEAPIVGPSDASSSNAKSIFGETISSSVQGLESSAAASASDSDASDDDDDDLYDDSRRITFPTSYDRTGSSESESSSRSLGSSKEYSCMQKGCPKKYSTKHLAQAHFAVVHGSKSLDHSARREVLRNDRNFEATSSTVGWVGGYMPSRERPDRAEDTNNDSYDHDGYSTLSSLSPLPESEAQDESDSSSSTEGSDPDEIKFYSSSTQSGGVNGDDPEPQASSPPRDESSQAGKEVVAPKSKRGKGASKKATSLREQVLKANNLRARSFENPSAQDLMSRHLDRRQSFSSNTSPATASRDCEFMTQALEDKKYADAVRILTEMEREKRRRAQVSGHNVVLVGEGARDTPSPVPSFDAESSVRARTSFQEHEFSGLDVELPVPFAQSMDAYSPGPMAPVHPAHTRNTPPPREPYSPGPMIPASQTYTRYTPSVRGPYSPAPMIQAPQAYARYTPQPMGLYSPRPMTPFSPARARNTLPPRERYSPKPMTPALQAYDRYTPEPENIASQAYARYTPEPENPAPQVSARYTPEPENPASQAYARYTQRPMGPYSPEQPAPQAYTSYTQQPMEPYSPEPENPAPQAYASYTQQPMGSYSPGQPYSAGPMNPAPQADARYAPPQRGPYSPEPMVPASRAHTRNTRSIQWVSENSSFNSKTRAASPLQASASTTRNLGQPDYSFIRFPTMPASVQNAAVAGPSTQTLSSSFQPANPRQNAVSSRKQLGPTLQDASRLPWFRSIADSISKGTAPSENDLLKLGKTAFNVFEKHAASDETDAEKGLTRLGSLTYTLIVNDVFDEIAIAIPASGPDGLLHTFDVLVPAINVLNGHNDAVPRPSTSVNPGRNAASSPKQSSRTSQQSDVPVPMIERSMKIAPKEAVLKWLGKASYNIFDKNTAPDGDAPERTLKQFGALTYTLMKKLVSDETRTATQISAQDIFSALTPVLEVLIWSRSTQNFLERQEGPSPPWLKRHHNTVWGGPSTQTTPSSSSYQPANLRESAASVAKSISTKTSPPEHALIELGKMAYTHLHNETTLGGTEGVLERLSWLTYVVIENETASGGITTEKVLERLGKIIYVLIEDKITSDSSTVSGKDVLEALGPALKALKLSKLGQQFLGTRVTPLPPPSWWRTGGAAEVPERPGTSLVRARGMATAPVDHPTNNAPRPRPRPRSRPASEFIPPDPPQSNPSAKKKRHRSSPKQPGSSALLARAQDTITAPVGRPNNNAPPSTPPPTRTSPAAGSASNSDPSPPIPPAKKRRRYSSPRQVKREKSKKNTSANPYTSAGLDFSATHDSSVNPDSYATTNASMTPNSSTTANPSTTSAPSTTPDGLLKCPQEDCNELFTLLADLNGHAASEHRMNGIAPKPREHKPLEANGEQFHCILSKCTNRFSRLDSAFVDRGDVHKKANKKDESADPRGKYRCPYPFCGEKAKRWASIRTHMENMHGL